MRLKIANIKGRIYENSSLYLVLYLNNSAQLLTEQIRPNRKIRENSTSSIICSFLLSSKKDKLNILWKNCAHGQILDSIEALNVEIFFVRRDQFNYLLGVRQWRYNTLV